MSIPKINQGQENSSEACWRNAISDADQLMQESSDEKEKHPFALAIDWFRYRLKSGANYPGVAETTPKGVTP